MGKPQQKYFPFKGGLDLVTQPLKVDPGKLLSCRNYEQGILGGYSRIQGYERYDGLPLPSDSSYWILGFTNGGLIALAAGMLLVGQTSGAVGEILSVTLDSGGWGIQTARGEARIFNVSGTFIDDEVISFIAADSSFSAGFSGGFA